MYLSVISVVGILLVCSLSVSVVGILLVCSLSVLSVVGILLVCVIQHVGLRHPHGRGLDVKRPRVFSTTLVK